MNKLNFKFFLSSWEQYQYSPNGGTQQDLGYAYDREGTIMAIKDDAPANGSTQGPGGLLRRFTHDPLRRLLSATGRESSNVYKQPSWDLNLRPQDYTATNTYTRSYQYDKLGNIQKLKHKAAGHANQDFDRKYSYETTHNKLVGFTVNSILFENKYDPNGNLAKEGQSRFYQWTANDKMAVFKNQAGSTPSVYTNYFYNAQGERIKKHTRKGKKIVVTFYMDGGLFETSYVKPTGGSIDNNRFYNTLHILDGSSRIATIRVGNNVDDHTPAITYIVGDPLNNSTAVLKTSGSLINREEYYPFGETSFGGFQYKRYRYNGKEKDEESGLYEYGARYYAPWVCRFVSVDPVAAKFADLSPYNYAGNRPITKVDIDGLQEKGRRGTPSGGGGAKKQTKDGNEKDRSGETINIAPLPDNVQREIDESLARAKANGDNIEITIHQTKEGYDVSIQTSPAKTNPQAESNELNLPQGPERAIRDQNKDQSYPKSTDNQNGKNSEGMALQPLQPKPAKPLSPETPADDRWKLVETIVEGYVEKTARLFKKGGEQLAKAARFLGKVSKGIGVVGAIIAGIDAYKEIVEKGATWKTVTKAAMGIGLGIGSIFFPPLAIPAFIYGVADYFGLVDKALNGIEKIANGVGDFFQELVYKTKKGFYDIEQGLRKGWRPVW